MLSDRGRSELGCSGVTYSSHFSLSHHEVQRFPALGPGGGPGDFLHPRDGGPQVGAVWRDGSQHRERGKCCRSKWFWEYSLNSICDIVLDEYIADINLFAFCKDSVETVQRRNNTDEKWTNKRYNPPLLNLTHSGALLLLLQNYDQELMVERESFTLIRDFMTFH